MIKHVRTPVIRVNGIGTVNVLPDRTSLQAGVITEGKNAAAVQAENSEAAAAVISALLQLGIERRDIKTKDYRLEILYDFTEGKQTMKGYKVTHILDIIVPGTLSAGKVIDEVVKSGANYIAGIAFEVSNSAKFYLKALSFAVQDAQKKAAALAESVHARIIPQPVEIIEHTSGGGDQVMGISTAAFTAKTVPIEPGQNQITAKITALFYYQVYSSQ
ncbi:SIMPL domain-containing protein [Peribacillus sp. SCS-37]|uniref:SIMPL domain-containing protein n=1 Tax=Paraperibacillus esterisolvens TaxID=3115296 RepID=UPI00390694FE